MSAAVTRYMWFFGIVGICVIEILIIFLTKGSLRKSIKSKDVVAGNANYWTKVVKRRLERLKIENEKLERHKKETSNGSKHTTANLRIH